jgi:plastocyanin
MAARCAALLLAVGLASPAGAGELRGRVQLAVPGLSLADVGPIVVYLDGGDGAPRAAAPAAEIRQRNASFSPPFLAVARGGAVSMPNDDAIYHNVFSFSEPNQFDLGLYPSGESRAVSFEHPGVVRIFCSIHESMNGTLFVAPSPWFAVVDPDGSYAITDIPNGRYRLRTWAEKLPPTEREVTLPAPPPLDLRIGDGGKQTN